MRNQLPKIIAKNIVVHTYVLDYEKINKQETKSTQKPDTPQNVPLNSENQKNQSSKTSKKIETVQIATQKSKKVIPPPKVTNPQITSKPKTQMT